MPALEEGLGEDSPKAAKPLANSTPLRTGVGEEERYYLGLDISRRLTNTSMVGRRVFNGCAVACAKARQDGKIAWPAKRKEA